MANREDTLRPLINNGPRDKRTIKRLYEEEEPEYKCTCGTRKGQGVCKSCLKREEDYYKEDF